MNKDKFFIYAGPAKTGSTWLYRTLSNHPEVEMPFVKELRYFYAWELVDKVNLFTNLFNEHWLFEKRRKFHLPILKQEIKNALQLKRVRWDVLYWYFKFLLLPNNDQWYQRLFSKNKLSGDISPHYATLSEKTIKKIYRLNPKAKIVIGLRDPIDRAWSDAKMSQVKHQGKKSTAEVEPSALMQFFESHHILSCKDYTSIIKKWGRYFPRSQMLIYYFEELQESPQQLFNRIAEFLKITPMKTESVSKNPNKGIVEEIPVEYEKELVQLNYKHIEDFAKEYPNKYSLAWLEKYKDYE